MNQKITNKKSFPRSDLLVVLLLSIALLIRPTLLEEIAEQMNGEL